MRRGQRALHYHLFAVAPLVIWRSSAKTGEDNGMNLYAEHNYAIKKLVVLSTQGLVDNSFFVKAAGIAQDTPMSLRLGEKSAGQRLCGALPRSGDLKITGAGAFTKLYVPGRSASRIDRRFWTNQRWRIFL